MHAPARVAMPRLMAACSIDAFTVKILFDLLEAVAGAREPAMLRTAPAIAFLIRRFEDPYVKSFAAGAGCLHSARFCSPAEKPRWLPIPSRFQCPHQSPPTPPHFTTP